MLLPKPVLMIAMLLTSTPVLADPTTVTTPRGTVIAWHVLRNASTLKGILQLTPVCSKEGFTADQLYPDISKVTGLSYRLLAMLIRHAIQGHFIVF